MNRLRLFMMAMICVVSFFSVHGMCCSYEHRSDVIYDAEILRNRAWSVTTPQVARSFARSAFACLDVLENKSCYALNSPDIDAHLYQYVQEFFWQVKSAKYAVRRLLRIYNPDPDSDYDFSGGSFATRQKFVVFAMNNIVRSFKDAHEDVVRCILNRADDDVDAEYMYDCQAYNKFAKTFWQPKNSRKYNIKRGNDYYAYNKFAKTFWHPKSSKRNNKKSYHRNAKKWTSGHKTGY
jgi:hypothetical protein